jgi:hypothetical protein
MEQTMVDAKKRVGFQRKSQRRAPDVPQVTGMTKVIAPEEDVYFHARWRYETQVFFKFVARMSGKTAVFWQQQAIDAFVSIKPWEAKPDSVRMERVPAKETVQVLIRLGRVLDKVNDISAALGVKPTVFVRAGAEWGTSWIPKVYQRIAGSPWDPKWSSVEYQLATLEGSAEKPL